MTKITSKGMWIEIGSLKKEDKKMRREQNKRYREKYREILNLKKQRAYHKENLEKKMAEK